MKSLKRTLSLVLVLVMVLGLVGIATATNFTDDDEIQYKEAVDVMVGIGAINGMGDGTFNPKGTITRAQAAKMVTYAVLGPTVAASLSGVVSSFTDVTYPAFDWAIPSIEYLVKQGVINGRGDGTFDPNGNITGYEIAKLLLCAAGYGRNGEYVGNGWELQAAIDANAQGIFAGAKTSSYGAAATREECALYIFNALTKIEMVVWNKTTDNYEPKVKVNAGDPKVTIAAATYPTLRKNPGVQNGYSGYTWMLGNAEISGFISSASVIGVITNVFATGGELYTKYGAAIGTVTALWINGTKYVAGDADFISFQAALAAVTRGNATRPLAAYNGATFTLVDGAGTGKIDTVMVSIPFLAKVDSVTPASATADRKINITVYGPGANVVTPSAIETDDFARNDFILIVPGSNNNAGFNSPTSMKLAKTITSNVSSYNSTNQTFVVEGTTYTKSAFTSTGFDDFTFAPAGLQSTFTFFLGENGTVIGSKIYSAGAAQNYMYVTKVEAKLGSSSIITGDAGNVIKVQATLMDGTTKVYDYPVKTASASVAAASGTVLSAGDDYYTYRDISGTVTYVLFDSAAVSGITTTFPAGMYAFTLDDDGGLNLSKKLASNDAAVTTGVKNAVSLTVAKGIATVTATGDTPNTLYASSSTKLVIVSGTGAVTYNGYANFPSTTFMVADYAVGYIKNSSGAITNILCIGAAVVDLQFDSYGLFLGLGDNTSSGQYYNLLVNGKVVSYLLTSDSEMPTAALALTPYAVALDSNGKAKLIDVSTSTVTESTGLAFVGENYLVTSASTAPASTLIYFASDIQVYNIIGAASGNIFSDELEAGDEVIFVTEGSGTSMRVVVAYING